MTLDPISRGQPRWEYKEGYQSVFFPKTVFTWCGETVLQVRTKYTNLMLWWLFGIPIITDHTPMRYIK